MTRIVYSGKAKEDVRKERNYYTQIHPELGQHFVATVEQAVRLIAAQPLAMQVIRDNIRRWPVKGFEHGILYRAEPDRIYVLAVFHPKQHPARWQGRAASKG